MKFCLSIIVFCLLIADLQAQPSIRLIDSTKKSWMPDGKGTVGLRFRNTGNQPLVVTSGKITSSSNVFRFLTNFSTPKIVAPGDTSYVIVEVNAQIAYEYLASVTLLSNDPARPAATIILRVNDSIPPNPVRALTTTPLKGGQLSINWQPPTTSRDKDSIVFYRVFILTKTGDNEEVYSGKGNSVVAKSAFENEVYVSVLTYDDMGNRSVTLDTTWLDHSKPKVWITEIDDQLAGIPSQIERGNPRIALSIRDWHMGRFDAYWREPGTLQLNPISQSNNFPQFKEDHASTFHWNTSQLRGKKELVLIARDQVDNIDTIVYPFIVSQIKGWPKRMLNHPYASSATIARDEGGRFLLTGSDIANGVFRPNGHHYFYNWPWDIIRSSTDQVITAAADFDKDGLSEIVTISRVDRVMILDHHGMTENEFGSVSATDRYANVIEDDNASYILTGPSPVAIRDGEAGQSRTFGATRSWYPNGDSADLLRADLTEGAREKDRFVIGNVASKDRESVIRVHDNGTTEEIGILDAAGSLQVGPISVWSPTSSYSGFYPSLGDIDGDGELDIVLPAANDSIYVYHGDGSPVEHYPVSVRSSTSGRNQALLVDVDRDGASDIILPVRDSIVAISGKSGQAIRNSIWPILRTGSGTSLLSIADLNSDGYLELIEPPEAGDTTWVYVYDLDLRNEPGTIEWGTFQHDMMRTGNYNSSSRELQSGVKAQQITRGLSLAGRSLNLENAGSVRITDNLGREVLSMTTQPNEPIDLSDLPSGVYMLIIDELEVTKIIL